MRALRYHGVAGVEEDRLPELDLATARLGLPQRGGEVGHLDEAEMRGDLPKVLGKLADLEPIGARDARHVGKFDRQRDHTLLPRARLLHMTDQKRPSAVRPPGQEARGSWDPRDLEFA